MSTLSLPAETPSVKTGRGFLIAALTVCTVAAVLAGWVPIRFSIATVFLFAGPHNWLEARYFLSRLPARWGKLQGYFYLAFTGIFTLAGGFCTLLWLAEKGSLTAETWITLYAGLQTLFILWVASLAHMRSQTNPRRDWGWIWPAAFLCIATAWMVPSLWGLGLVYLHPLMALWLLDRELKRSRPEWRSAYHTCLVFLPFFVGFLIWRLGAVPSLPVEDELSQRISDHAGASILPMMSSHLLVALHTFLEMIHYGVWIVAIPLISLRSAPWQLKGIPMAWRGTSWQVGLTLLLLSGAFIVLVLWTGFLIDYPTTRTIYFAVAILHVLAEFPFLLRSL